MGFSPQSDVSAATRRKTAQAFDALPLSRQESYIDRARAKLLTQVRHHKLTPEQRVAEIRYLAVTAYERDRDATRRPPTPVQSFGGAL